MALPLGFEVHPLHRTLAPGSTTTEHVLIRVRARETQGRVRPRLAAVLVLDVSGSMAGEPLEHVIRSAVRITSILDDRDALGVVAFENSAHTIAKVRTLDRDARRDIARAIEQLRTMGSTNLSDGLARAALLLPPREEHQRQLALVMSDGHPNVGTSTATGLAEETGMIRARGVAVSTLGFGANHDEDVLVAISDAGGGRYAFINDPKLADASFARALGAQRDVVAEDLDLVLAPSVGVEIVRVLGGPPTSFSADGLRVQLSDAIAGDEFNAVVELRVEAIPETGPWCPLRVTLEGRALGSKTVERLRDEVAVEVTRGAPREADAEVGAFVAIALAGEARTEARAMADRGNFAGAAAVLRKAREMVAACPGFKDESSHGQALWDTYETLVDDIRAMENRPDPEAYANYKKATRDYAQFAAGGLKGTQGTPIAMSPGANMLARLIQQGAARPARLIVRRDGAPVEVISLDRPEMVIGRTRDCDVHIETQSLSRRHTRIVFVDGAFWVFDLGSTNGTHVNGAAVQRHRLVPGDVIRYGDVEMVYEES